MTLLARALAGAALLALAFVVRRGGREPEGADDRGGVGHVATGLLYLRAEALRREGRLDEVAAAYRRILEIEPASEGAADRLVDTLATDLRALAPTPEGRVGWWREAASLLDHALRTRPDSARLHWRRASLLLQVAGADPAVAAALAEQGIDRELEGVASLREAMRHAEAIPGVGRIHLEAMARRAPALAAERLARGGDPGPFLDAGSEALARRGPVLEEIRLDPDLPVSAAVRLRAGLRLVGHVRDDLGALPPRKEDARALLDAYRRTLGEDAVVRALDPLLR